jgi:hypothetical protein
MVHKIHYDILDALTLRILDELCSLVRENSKLMVCDWRAYAVLEAYRQYNHIIDQIAIPTIDECFSGSATTTGIANTEQWKYLTKMHDFHWHRSQDVNHSSEYEELFNICSLRLHNYVLTI